jgi:hypothetical protein
MSKLVSLVNAQVMEFDPNGAYPGVAQNTLLEACGLIGHWMSVSDDPSLVKRVEDNYQFGIYWMDGGTVDETGKYKYPGDPALNPIVKWETDTEIAYMYEYAMMAFVNKATKETRVTRVD